MLRTKRVGIVLLALLLALCTSTAFAQKSTGAIVGVVTDVSGAVVPGAEVTAKNPDTGLVRTVTSGEAGDYSVLELPVGTYSVSVKKSGFKETVVGNVEVHVANNTSINAVLQIGQTSENIIVDATALQVQTTSAAVGAVVEGRQVRELPMNGRNFVQLTQMQPGVSGFDANLNTTGKGLAGGVDFSVNGNPVTNNLFLVDGVNNNDVGSNRTILTYPSIDAIAEFKMLRNSYGPEYGQASGAIINITTRSGSNQFHGSAYYFGRNDALNAAEYFAARNDAKDVLRRNDFGFTVGGPVVKDKLFFFVSEEWNKEKRANTRSSCVPTEAERNGDFSAGSICGVAKADGAFRGTIANPDEAGQLIMQLMPLPNLATPVNGNNWSMSIMSPQNYRQDNFRADYNLTPSTTITGRFTQDKWENPAPNQQRYWGDDPFPVVEGSWTQPSKQILGKITSTIGSTMVNDAQFAYSNNRINIISGGSNPTIEDQLATAIPPTFDESMKLKHTGTPTVAGLNPYGSGNLQNISPWENSLDLYSVRDDLSKIAANHTLKAGVFFGWNSKNENSAANSGERPTINATNLANPEASTGNPIANLLTPGMVFRTAETSTNVQTQLRWRDYEAYFGDTWKVRRNVTLELGVRYSILAPPFAANDKMSRFDPRYYDPTRPASDACNGLVIVPGTNPCNDSNNQFGTAFSAGTPASSRSLVDTNYHAFAPRLGVAWDVFGNGATAVRIGLGQFYQRERASIAFVETTNAPFALNISNVDRPLGVRPASIGVPVTSPSGGRDSSNLLPNSWQWNLTIEQSLAKETAIELGYVGNRGIHLTSSEDINAVLPQNRAAAAFCNGACSQYRPYSNFGGLQYWGHRGDSNYHSLQALFRTRFKRSTVQAAYTWSHSISLNNLTDSNGGGLNANAFTDRYNVGLDRGNSAINRPHIFVANAVLDMPTFSDRGAFMKQVAGGWEFGIIQTISSGQSQNILAGVNGLNGGSVNLNGTGLNANARPNRVAGVECSDGNSKERIYNPAAFTLVGYRPGTVGTAGPGSCLGPGRLNTDFALYKNWKVPAFGENVGIQFRLELFNAFNHAQFRPNTGSNIFDIAQGQVTVEDGVITSYVPNPGFGMSNSTTGPREIQYALKLTF